MNQAEIIAAQAARVRASQVLGRSRLVNRLFDFLVECSLTGRNPKEIEIAIDGLGRDGRFDPSQDAVVRVCLHKLRRRLDDFYAGPGSQEQSRLHLAKGEYRLLIEERSVEEIRIAEQKTSPVPVAMPQPRPWLPLALLWALGASVGANLLLWILASGSPSSADILLDKTRASALWAPLLDDELPIYLVVGNYYMFGEVDEFLDVQRLVRDFQINSREDLEWSGQRDTEGPPHFQDLNMDYVPTASAHALREIVPVLAHVNERVRVALASDMDPALFKSAHIIYVGLLSGMGMLREPAFAGSRFTSGETHDELVDMTTGIHYSTDVGGPVKGQLRYQDYGYLSTFPGPAGNQIIVVAGTRDTAVMEMAETVVDVSRLNKVEATAGPRTALEAVYEVYSFENTNIDATLLFTAPLDSSEIWSANGSSESQPQHEYQHRR